MAHYAGLIAAGFYPNPVPFADVVTSTTHKTLRGPRGGIILMKAEHEKAINSAIFPGLQGGPLMHVIAAKAVAFKEAATPEFRNYQEQVMPTPASWLACCPKSAACASFPAVPKATSSCSTCAPRTSPARSRSGARPCPHHGQQERHPERSAEAFRHLRYPHRFAGDDDARLHRDRSRAGRPSGRRRARCAERRSRAAAQVRAKVRRCASSRSTALSTSALAMKCASRS
jgi:hypothetical protein